MDRDSLRSGLLGAVGVYLIYTAYQLFMGRDAPDSGMSPTTAVLFAVLFAVCGAAVAVYAWALWRGAFRKGRDDDDTNTREGEHLK